MSGTLSTLDLGGLSLGTKSSSLSLLSVSASAPSADAGACVQNPCNPYCVGIDVDAGSLMPEAGAGSTTVILGTVKTPDQFPGGITGPKNAMGTYAVNGPPARVACTQAHPPADGKICSSDYCCANYAVGGSPFTCQPWVTVGGDNPIATANCVRATGVDFQLGLACNDASANVLVPACNRGTADATSGTVMIAEYPGNPNYAGDLRSAPNGYCDNPGNPSAYCLVNLAQKPIPAGKCIEVNLSQGTASGTTAGVSCSAALFSSGNRTMMINPITPPLAGASTFSPAYTTVAEADYCNNYSFHPTVAQGGTCSAYGSQPPSSGSSTYTYTSTCPAGYGTVWNQLAYDTSVPSASEIVFAVSTAPLLSDGGSGTFTTPVNAADIKSSGGGDPATCTISGSPDASACPKNLSTILGSPANSHELLMISVTETATSATPVVNGWQVSFNCVPNQ
jgi:hypothetical protein